MKAGVEEVVAMATVDEGIARFLAAGEMVEGGIPLSAIRQKAASDLTVYASVLLKELDARGIHVPPAVQLHSEESGRVVALGGHPKAQAITELLGADSFLLKRFKEVEVLHVLLRRAELRKNNLPMTNQHFNLGLTSLGCLAFFTEG